MLSRREFLKEAGLFTLGAPFLVRGSLRLEKPSCIVIGAGLAGLSAAYRLAGAGWRVTVVEARRRTGGRVFTHRPEANGSLVCELGAEWIGEDHHEIRKLCGVLGVELRRHQYKDRLLRDGQVYAPDQWSYSSGAQDAFERFRAEYKNYSDEDRQRLDGYDWWTWLRDLGYPEDDLRLRDLLDSTDFGESIRHVSAYAAASEYMESNETNEMDWNIVGGNSTLAQRLVDRIGEANVLLGTKVTAIRQRGGKVRIEIEPGGPYSCDAPAGGVAGWCEADACVCTVPSRVLTSIVFDPPLPKEQQHAAEQLQYSRIIKSQVLFDERFWGAEDWSLASDRTSHYYFHATQGQAGRQGIMTSYAIGDKADVLASQNDRHRQEIIAADLAFADARAPKLAIETRSYAWQRDPHTQGAYAVYRPGQWFTVRPTLQRPHGKVLFAGEHLAEWQGFMEGAVATGLEAANELID